MESIWKELESFWQSVMQLSASVNKASPLWKDEKFWELSASVGEIAKQSKDVKTAGEQCRNALNRFNTIAEEEY